MCQDPIKIRDPGSGILTDSGSWVGILSKDSVDPGSCSHIFRDPVALGSCLEKILLDPGILDLAPRKLFGAGGSSTIKETFLMDDVDL